MRRWYLLRTKPACERLAEHHLQRQGYASYLPRLLLRTRYRGGRAQERVVPLFPGYLFLHLDEGLQALAPVRSTRGVSAAVRFGPQYAVVPDAVVGELRTRADPATGLHRLRPEPQLAPGSRVRVCGGAFAGMQGIFQCEAGAQRVLILLHILGQHARVHVPLELLERDDAA